MAPHLPETWQFVLSVMGADHPQHSEMSEPDKVTCFAWSERAYCVASSKLSDLPLSGAHF
jgi:hypothetical protein